MLFFSSIFEAIEKKRNERTWCAVKISNCFFFLFYSQRKKNLMKIFLSKRFWRTMRNDQQMFRLDTNLNVVDHCQMERYMSKLIQLVLSSGSKEAKESSFDYDNYCVEALICDELVWISIDLFALKGFITKRIEEK